jgi:outer membrane lipoprotein-sorting protein
MNIMRTIIATMVLIGLAVLQACPAGAQDAGELMKQVRSRASWEDMQGELKMTLTNKRGDKRLREVKLWSKQSKADEQRMLMRFVSPADVRGTGFLLIEHDDGEDDMRLFMPALRRVQRISSSGKGGNFMSSDFTYYDIGAYKLKDWNFSVDGETTVDGVPCVLVAGQAVSEKVVEDTGYAKIVWSVDTQRMTILAADYYDEGGRKFKTMRVLEVEDISGVPFATHMRMENLSSGHSSEMIFADLATNTGIADNTFTERNLRRWTR